MPHGTDVLRRHCREAACATTLIAALSCGTSAGAPASALVDGEGGVAAEPTGDVDAAPAQRDADAAGERQPRPGRFELAWEDQLDAFDASRWQLMTHSWDGNLAQFSPENVSYANGIASLHLTQAESDVAKPFRGVEMRSRETLTYGKVEARARFSGKSAVISALVLIYTPYPADDWNELDIEYLGRYRDRIQFNAMVYTGPPTVAPVVTSVTPTASPLIVAVSDDPAADFHVYAIEWTPDDARFTIDGEVKRTWSTRIDLMKRPQNILLTIWASSSASWAGPILSDTAPTQAEYDWVRVYRWQPEAP